MHYTRLGTSGLKVSRIALGCMSFGDRHAACTVDARRRRRRADLPAGRRARASRSGTPRTSTARGTSEEVVGRAIRKYTQREDVVLATKLFRPDARRAPAGPACPARRSWSRSTPRCAAWAPTTSTSTRSTASTPTPRSRRPWRRCTTSSRPARSATSAPRRMWAWQFAKMQHAADRDGWTRFVSMQDQYSLIQREEEREMFGLLADQGVGLDPVEPAGRRAGGPPLGRARPPPRRDQPDTTVRHARSACDSDQAIVDAVRADRRRTRASRWRRSRWPGC